MFFAKIHKIKSVLAEMTDPDYQGEIDLHSEMKVRKPKSENQEIP